MGKWRSRRSLEFARWGVAALSVASVSVSCRGTGTGRTFAGSIEEAGATRRRGRGLSQFVGREVAMFFFLRRRACCSSSPILSARYARGALQREMLRTGVTLSSLMLPNISLVVTKALQR